MPVSIVPIKDKVTGSDSIPSHCELVYLLGLNVIDDATFLPHVPTNCPSFFYQPSVRGRMDVFAATAGSITRAWILSLPETGAPYRVMIGIQPSIGQAAGYYGPLGGNNPLSVPLIRDTIALGNGMDPVTLDMRDGKVQACYGSQVLGSDRPMALLIPVRTLVPAAAQPPNSAPLHATVR